MKLKVILILTISIALFPFKGFSQNNYINDSIKASEFSDKALHYANAGKYDSCIVQYGLASKLFEKCRIWDKFLESENYAGFYFTINQRNDTAILVLSHAIQKAKEIYGDQCSYISQSYKNIANAYSNLGMYDTAIVYMNKSIEIRKELFGEKSFIYAKTIYNLGIIFQSKYSFDSALNCYFKCLDICKSLPGSDKDIQVSYCYFAIGQVYSTRNEFEQAIEFLKNAFEMDKKILGENHPDIILDYSALGTLYRNEGEFYLGLEYQFKALGLSVELLGENHRYTIDCIENIGNVYLDLKDYGKAMEYKTRALKLRLENLGEDHPSIPRTYVNIAGCFQEMGNNDSALVYYHKAEVTARKINEGMDMEIASIYQNTGMIYLKRNQNEQAFQCFSKATRILITLYDSKNPELAYNYNLIGNQYLSINEYKKSLLFYQKALVSNLSGFNDTIDFYAPFGLENYFHPKNLLISLIGKAEVLQALYGQTNMEQNLLTAFDLYLKCDSMIDKMRQTYLSYNDKIELGGLANSVYEGAIACCYKLSEIKPNTKNNNNWDEQAFYFSEKSKAQAFLQTLVWSESLKYSGIPDSLLIEEHKLQVDIGFYEQELAGMPDSASELQYRSKIFALNQEYNELIASFEKNFPEYHALKYASAKKKDIISLQKQLDKKTAIRSYFIGESEIYIFTLTNKKLEVNKINRIENFEDTVRLFCYSISKADGSLAGLYLKTANSLTHQLFPELFINKSSALTEGIEKLIIIPDDILAILPFEALLTKVENQSAVAFSQLPYLIRKFNVTYCYSTDLLYKLNPEKPAKSTGFITWSGIAPVFSNQNDSTLAIMTRQLYNNDTCSDTISISERYIDVKSKKISPLPFTKDEVEKISKEFTIRKYKANCYLNADATENIFKSGQLSNSKILHFATHGFINPHHPELSGILLAPDTTCGNDGILYSGEIYNSRLNSDLVVLSACQTGLGKVMKGEGLIGLTRSILFAGADNVIVSLWNVNDKSTSDFMVNFYHNLLAKKPAIDRNLKYCSSLRKAKLEMINDNEFANPFYWAPFIIIGQ